MSKILSGDVVPIPRLPEVSIVRKVLVPSNILKLPDALPSSQVVWSVSSKTKEADVPEICKDLAKEFGELGEVVPIPTLPPSLTVRPAPLSSNIFTFLLFAA